MQITELALGTSPTDTSLWKLNYEYGELDQNGNLIASKNNGNIAKQLLSYQGLSNPFVQAFKYDSLDRLVEAKETTNGSQNWIQTFDYDRYGNRISFSQTVGTQQLAINNLTLPSVDPLKNRFTTGQGYTYDFNGNLITDAQNRNFSFNGDNKQVEVRDSANNLVGQYFYDSDGRRVKKISAAETTIFVYDGMGKLVEEYSTQLSPTPTTSYVVTDTLQSVRAITNAQGELISRRDFMPFGEELYAGTPNRTESLKYSQSGVDNIRKRFTGYEKDTETGLDFAEARYYNNQHGRFTAVDPLLSSGKSTNPQTFNRYTYVLNCPLILTDSTGMQLDQQSENGTSFTDWLYEELGILRINVFTFSGRYEWRMGGNGVVEERPAFSTSIAGQTFDSEISLQRTVANLKDVGTGAGKGGRNFGRGIVNSPFEFQPVINGIPQPSFYESTGWRPLDYETPDNFQEGVGMFTSQVALTAATAKAPSFLASRFSSTTFYTVQSVDDIARLKAGGAPWPTEATRSALGEGIYSWGNRATAQNYLSAIEQRGVSGLQIQPFSVRNSTLTRFRTLNVDKLAQPESWMTRYSKLWGGTPNHGYQYIQRGTRFGTEHFFDKSVTTNFRFR